MLNLKQFAIKITDKEYHALPVWSYSKIAKYAKGGFASLDTLDEPVAPTPSMVFGSLFDALITEGKRGWDKYTYIENSVPESTQKVLDYLLAHTNAQDFSELQPQDFEKAFDACEYYTRYKFETKLGYVTPYAEYFNKARSGKIIVPKDYLDDAYKMACIFKNNPLTNSIFKHNSKAEPHKEYLYQQKFIVKHTLSNGEEIDVKIMLDLMIVDHEQKTIQIVDLKTSADPAWNFKENFLKFHYYLQAQVYSDSISILAESDGYTVLPFIFVDISRSDMVPVSYIYDQTDDSQLDGFCFTTNDRTYKYKSWKALVEEIMNYQQTGAKVPSYISITEHNNILDIITR